LFNSEGVKGMPCNVGSDDDDGAALLLAGGRN
jgi:hypothetical protein